MSPAQNTAIILWFISYTFENINIPYPAWQNSPAQLPRGLYHSSSARKTWFKSRVSMFTSELCCLERVWHFTKICLALPPAWRIKEVCHPPASLSTLWVGARGRQIPRYHKENSKMEKQTHCLRSPNTGKHRLPPWTDVHSWFKQQHFFMVFFSRSKDALWFLSNDS